MNEEKYYTVTLYFVSGDKSSIRWERNAWDRIKKTIEQGSYNFNSTPRDSIGSYINFTHVTHIVVEEDSEEESKGWFK